MSSSPSIANCNDAEVLKTLISDLESEVKEKTSENACYEAEIRALQRKLVKKDAEILRQERELHKLRVRFKVSQSPKMFIKDTLGFTNKVQFLLMMPLPGLQCE